MKNFHRSGTLRSAAPVACFCVLLLALSSCDQTRRDPDAAKMGRVTLALSAAGPDGASYRLPSGSALLATNQDTEIVHVLSLDGEEITKTSILPAGSYEAEVVDAHSREIRTLLRGADLAPVPAVLRPVEPFTIVEDQTTVVVLHFVVQQVGDIAFSTGNATLSVEIETAAAAPSSLSVAGTFFAAFQNLRGDQDLVDYFTTAPEVGIDYAISVSWPHSWVFQDDVICGDVQGLGVTADAPAAGLSRLLNQTLTGRGQLCFDKSPDNRISLSLQKRPGDDELFTSFADHSPRSTPVQSFSWSATYTLPEAVWDGHSLRLSVLAEGRSAILEDFGNVQGRSAKSEQRLLTFFAPGGAHKVLVDP